MIKYNLLLFVALLLGASISSAQARDSNVFKAQRILSVIGYNPGPIDGLWGRKTEMALK